MPLRVQLKRTQGWRMPAGTVKVDRTTKWGNPYKFGHAERRGHKNTVILSQEGLVAAFRRYCERCLELDSQYFEPLRGKHLACWCPLDQPCHADVLLELANQPDREG